jgi:hypothetical protein
VGVVVHDHSKVGVVAQKWAWPGIFRAHYIYVPGSLLMNLATMLDLEIWQFLGPRTTDETTDIPIALPLLRMRTRGNNNHAPINAHYQVMINHSKTGTD